MNNNINFFLSYSRDADNEIINKIVDRLEFFGFYIWRDKEDVILGYNIQSSLYNTLDECKLWDGMITIIDKTYLTKDWCLRELNYAIDNHINLYPILLFMSKKELPEKYEIINSINICTIKNHSDLNYSIYKIIMRFLTDYKANIISNKYCLNNSILNSLVSDFYIGNKNSNNIIFACDNIGMCIKCLLKNCNKHFGYRESIIFNIIHCLKNEYVVSEGLNRLDIRIIVKATECLLKKYYS